MDDRRNKYDTKGCLEAGDSAENTFHSIAENRGWSLESASVDANMNKHWDYLIRRNDEAYKVEVKAMKRISRQDAAVQDTWHWIELHGVRAKDPGWLYGGKADLLAFERRASFLIVGRARLVGLIDELVDFDHVVESPLDAKYAIYSRAGRPDKITLIETVKMEPIKWDEWAKA